MAKWKVIYQPYMDATRPWAVVAMFRTFNRVKGRYETEAQAKRRVRDLNKEA